MFKCSECQKEYDIKPDYCEECGNDIFEEVVIQKQAESQTQIPKATEETKQPDAIKQEVKTQKEDFKQEPKYEPKREIKPEDMVSFGIFGLCILLSFIIVFFINPAPKEETVVEKEEIKIADIPSLDSFWNNKAPEVQIQQPKQQPIIKMPEPEVQIQQAPAKPEAKTTKVELKYIPKSNVNKQIKVQPQAQPKTQPKVQSKTQTTTQKQQNKTTTAQNKQTATKPAVQSQQTQQKPATKTAQTVPQTQQSQKPQPIQVQTSTQTTQAQTKPTQTQDNSLALKKEFSSYKINLRNTIGRKIDFADVIGDGSCSISFKIDSTGKLINRAFSKQSTNLTLNNAVYKAVMQTPSYNPPPLGYKGETLILKISFYNGNFEINLN